MVTIRQVQETDGLALSLLLNQLDAETPFMAMGEQNSAEELSQHLGLFIDSAAQVLLVVETKDMQLIGFAIGITGYISGDRNTAALVIGIKQAHVGMGFGRQLLTHIEDWAQDAQLQQLELAVMNNNDNAIVFYENMGFKQQIIQPGSLVSELTKNELYMIKAVNLQEAE
ncbi:GNAT family N-acetyltransferase [Moritella marina ATCC 15381]|uniref:GNAT family N-acetyltransferase n=1 Tax=Moritella marina ATCC 15381 TaxID=1202962 RepID=A0A5J6WGV7_MORMI|nr:GNAT family N-acetyltransferase [Moritella marina]QFI36458.1 GNAT family N-acetyltransferase [Moritella marina ATCC 15381]